MSQNRSLHVDGPVIRYRRSVLSVQNFRGRRTHAHRTCHDHTVVSNGSRVKKLIVLVLLACCGWLLLHEPNANWRGTPAAHEPVQTSPILPATFRSGDFSVTPLATYSLTAVVLSRSRYRYDAGAKIAPVDLALGWGPMSIAGVINELSISQSGRWYEYSYRNDPPLDPTQIARNSANTHCIPANDDVRRQLLDVKRHELVTLSGYLVEVTRADGFRWRSSLTREDTGGGACEIVWITTLEHHPL